MSKNRWLIVLLLVTLCSPNMYAQDATRLLGVEEMFRLADENSRSIRSFSVGKEAADEALKAAKSKRLPDINISASVSYLGNGYLMDRDYTNGNSVPMPHFGNNFSIEAQQVIYAGGAIDGSIALAELSKKMSNLDWLKNRQEIRFLLVGHYLDLYKLNNQSEVLQRNLELTEQVIRNMQSRHGEGTVIKNDITRYELQRENLLLQLEKVKDMCKILNNQLNTTLHLPEGTVILPDTTLLDNRVVPDVENYWKDLASTNNIILQQAGLGVQISRQKEKLERSELLPKIAMVAVDHLDGPITIEVPVIDKNFNYWYVGLGVKYSLSSLYKNNKSVKQSRLNVRRAQEEYALAQEEINNRVQSNYINMMTSFTEVRTQEKSVELANENYNITSNRYKNDLALLTDMLDASNMKLSAELNLVNARINLIYNYYKVKYITHTL